MARILVVEDDQTVLRHIRDILRFEHHIVDCCDHGDKAIEYFERYVYDLILLDWELPGLSGIALVKEYKNNGGLSPVVMLTGRDATPDKIRGLDAGADNYVTKPFVAEELLAIVRASLRRSPERLPDLEFKDIKLEPQSAAAYAAGVKLDLTRNELEFLRLLLTNLNKYVPNELVLSKVWGDTTAGNADAVRHCASNLRQKLQATGSTVNIANLRGVGYKLV